MILKSSNAADNSGHMLTGDAMFRGLGALVLKSALLLWVLAQPFSPRRIALVLLGAGVGPVPRKQLAVEP